MIVHIVCRIIPSRDASTFATPSRHGGSSSTTDARAIRLARMASFQVRQATPNARTAEGVGGYTFDVSRTFKSWCHAYMCVCVCVYNADERKLKGNLFLRRALRLRFMVYAVV